jgi:hypothetical protein
VVTEYPWFESMGGGGSATGALGDGYVGVEDARGLGLGFGRAIGITGSPVLEGFGVTFGEPGIPGTAGITGASGIEIDAG